MTVLVTGADGYLGWPTVLRLSETLDQRIIGVDNQARRKWVEQSGSKSAIPIQNPQTRFNTKQNISYIQTDLSKKENVDQLLTVYEPETILHLAAQPSAPYSSINGERALYTQKNNISMNINLLHGLKENDLEDTHLIETTTTGVYGSPSFEIPEGGLNVERKGDEDYVPFPNMAGSWYHNTKSFDGANLRLAVTNWDQPITDIRTAIVYGTQTEETNSYSSPTRFDFDYYFGTVVNRFCAQAVPGYPITVYGKGEQRKPMVSLQDAVESLKRAVENGYSGDGDSVDVYNQVTRPVAIVELAETIQEVGREFGLDPDIEHFENPREEDEQHKMEIENSKFMDLLGGNQRQTLEEGIRDILEDLMEYQSRIKAHEDRFLPGVLTD